MRSFVQCLAVSSVFLLLCAAPGIAAPGRASQGGVSRRVVAPERDHLIVMVFDQMRPDYIDRFDLKSFKRLRAISTEYSEAYVGHIPSITLVSHGVISTGMLPKQLPWHDNIFLDVHGVFGKVGLFYDAGSFRLPQWEKLYSTISSEDFLATLIKRKYGGKVFAVGEKEYAASTFGTPAADAIITLRKENGVCAPAGRNVPEYILKNDRFTLNCSERFGTKESFYPLDGARLVPGNDTAHLGGDVWAREVAQRLIENENWSALFLTFGGIDKVGHIEGTLDCALDHPFESEYSLEATAKIADTELGMLLDTLEEKKLLGRTVLVSTADHGGQSDKYYLGSADHGRLGNFENDHEDYGPPPFWIKRISQFGRVTAASYDTAVRLWIDAAETDRKKFRRALAEISGVQAIYELSRRDGRFEYVPVSFKGCSIEASAWARRHNKDLANTLAAEGSADYLLFFADGVGFGLLGDHGGAQELVQRIPLFVSNQERRRRVDKTEYRLVDVKWLVSREMDLDDRRRGRRRLP